MRITTGILKGKKLISPKLKNLRLTEEKVRKAIFDVLGEFVERAVVLELFAGSGALGLEAISRGASSVTFVDNDKECIEVVKRNIPPEIKPKTKVMRIDCFRAIDYFSCHEERFNLIILDPPYKKGLVSLILKKISESSILLEPEALIVVEHHGEEKLGELGNLFLLKQRRYGEVFVSFLKLKDK
ncbi:MAG: 16S rRNA (guanine(966)-N(2))-methyltransferase RsmD [Candidatus Omnitrophica bacterium]|nr:16S rRNA (guanine(966)-N(2))-methyltransferase RsmD [Candidatus Omnitrophota bacterium]